NVVPAGVLADVSGQDEPAVLLSDERHCLRNRRPERGRDLAAAAERPVERAVPEVADETELGAVAVAPADDELSVRLDAGRPRDAVGDSGADRRRHDAALAEAPVDGAGSGVA